MPRFSLFFFSSKESGPPRYASLLRFVRFADENGFHAVWFPERHMVDFGALYPNPATLAAAVATVTRRVQLRAGSVVVPLHHPLRLCEDWSIVDNLSDGRVGLSLASGWHPDDFVFAPDLYGRRREVTFQALQTLRSLWQGETVSMRGPNDRTVQVRLRPKPVQPSLPIWITTGGTPATIEGAARARANLLLSAIGHTFAQLRDILQTYRGAWPDESRGQVTLMLHTYVTESDDSVRATVERPLMEYISDFLTQTDRGLSPDQLRSAARFAFERYIRTNALLGSIEHCSTVVDQATAIGVDEIACLIDFGLDEPTVWQGLQRLAALRDRYEAPVVV